MQKPHSLHPSSITCAFSFTIITAMGHTGSHFAQPLHFTRLINIAMLLPLSKINRWPVLSSVLILSGVPAGCIESYRRSLFVSRNQNCRIILIFCHCQDIIRFYVFVIFFYRDIFSSLKNYIMQFFVYNFIYYTITYL